MMRNGIIPRGDEQRRCKTGPLQR